MKKELLKIIKDLEEISTELEKGIEWGENNIEETVRDLEQCIKDLKNLAEASIELDDLEAVHNYEAQAENLIENSINEIIEESK
mgnify:CR=1 FL=1